MPTVKSSKYQFLWCNKVSWSRRKRIGRAGVILYFKDKELGKHRYILGLDKNFEEWTDFGGQLNEGELGYIGAFREMREETLNIFDEFFTDDLSQHLKEWTTIIEQSMAILFVPVPINDFLPWKQRYEEEVSKCKQNNTEFENVKIDAFTIPEIEALLRKEFIHEHKMYEVVRNHMLPRWNDFKHWDKLESSDHYSDYEEISPRFSSSPSISPSRPKERRQSFDKGQINDGPPNKKKLCRSQDNLVMKSDGTGRPPPESDQKPIRSWKKQPK